MKKIIVFLLMVIVGLVIKAQSPVNPFPTLDSLEKFTNKYIRNSAVEGFQNLRLNSAIIGLTRFIDSSYGGQVRSFSKVNDSTLRLVTLKGDTMDVTGISGSGSVDLDSLRTDSTVIVVNSTGGSDALIFPADTVRAGVMRARDKKKLDRIEIVGSSVELRAVTNVSTNVIYRIIENKIIGDFYYDPDDNSTADDSVMTVVNVDGKRFKRYYEDKIFVKWFGAKGNNTGNDAPAIQKAINWMIAHPEAPRILYFHKGTYRTTEPIDVMKFENGQYQFVTIILEGPSPAKEAPSEYLATISVSDRTTYGINFQRSRNCGIRNLMFNGAFSFPTTISPFRVDTLKFAEWTDGITRDNRESPYAAVVIDAYCDSTKLYDAANKYPGQNAKYIGTSRSGTSGFTLENVRIQKFVVGFMVGPNNWIQNQEMINVVNCEIDYCKVSIAFTQDQTKENHIKGLKVWSATHTVVDGSTYGKREGNLPFVYGMNLAGAVHQIFNITTTNFGGSVYNIYAEALVKIGYVGGSSGAHFVGCQFNFINDAANYPSPDYYVHGNGLTFTNCQFRVYNGLNKHRMIFSGIDANFINCNTNALPISVNLANSGVGYTSPSYRDLSFYYLGSNAGGGVATTARTNATAVNNFQYYNNDIPYPGQTYSYKPTSGSTITTRHRTSGERTVLLGSTTVHVTRNNFHGFFKLPTATDTNRIQVNDYILTSNCEFYDQKKGVINCGTAIVGIVTAKSNDTIFVDNVGINIDSGSTKTLYVNFYVRNGAVITGNITIGSETITNVQTLGSFPSAGARLDINEFPDGAYVVSTDAGAKTITMSRPATASQNSVTIINGNPEVTIESTSDPVRSSLTLGIPMIGGATFIQTDSIGGSARGRNGDRYYITNTVIAGDTSLHKLAFRGINTQNTAIGLPSGATGTRLTYHRNGAFRLNTDSTTNGIPRPEIYWDGSWYTLPYRTEVGSGGGGSYTFQHSLTESSGTVNLVGDDASPGNSKYYGTNGSGIKGFYDLPSGGSGSPGGSGTEMQYRSDGSTFGGAAGTSWDNTNRLFTLEKALDATQSLSGGWLLKNPTSATSGNQKISPPLWLEGNGFETTGSTSQSVRLGFDVLPVQGTTTYGTLRLLQSVNGGTISTPMTFATGTNIMTLAGSSTVGRLNLTSDGSSYIRRDGNLFHIIGHNGISSRSSGTMTVYSGTTTVDPNGYSNAFFNVIRTTLPQIAAVYDASNYTTFGTSSSGILTIAPSGGLSNFTGRLRVSALDTDGSAPTTSGTTKMVITDGNGELSFADIPSGGGSSPYIYQFISTQQVTVTNTTTETTIYGTGEGSAGIDGSANITTGTQIVLKGAGEINTDASSAPTLQLNFKTPTSTVTFNITDLATGLNQSPYTYEYKLIPLGTGTSQSYIWQFDFYCENNLNPVVYKFGGRETSALTTTGTVTIDVTVEWSAADDDNTLVANYNTIEIFKK